MNCEVCGTELPFGAMFCGECGRAVGSRAPQPFFGRSRSAEIAPPLAGAQAAALVGAQPGDTRIIEPLDPDLVDSHGFGGLGALDAFVALNEAREADAASSHASDEVAHDEVAEDEGAADEASADEVAEDEDAAHEFVGDEVAASASDDDDNDDDDKEYGDGFASSAGSLDEVEQDLDPATVAADLDEEKDSEPVSPDDDLPALVEPGTAPAEESGGGSVDADPVPELASDESQEPEPAQESEPAVAPEPVLAAAPVAAAAPPSSSRSIFAQRRASAAVSAAAAAAASVPTPSVPTPPVSPPRPDPFPWGEPLVADPLSDDLEQTLIVQRREQGERFILQFSTGESVSVFGTGLLGRNPSPQPGEYFDQLVAISDPGKSVSKTHLEFGQEGGAFWVSDRFSGNGSIVREPEAAAKRLTAGKRYRIVRGTRVDIGEQFFIVS
jgi:hypothetical protein